jgi:hypothetical protein
MFGGMRSRLWAAAGLVCLVAGAAQAGLHVDMGDMDGIALDQPRVAFELYDPPDHSFGPDLFNTFLLDTAAQATIAGGFAVEEMSEQGYHTVGQFSELGIGTNVYDVSDVYNMRFAGSDGLPLTLENVQILSHATADFGFDGIVGSPAMAGRVTSFDLRPMTNWNFIEVAFGSTVPPGNGHRYSVAVDLVAFPPPVQDPPDGPKPTYGPLPFVMCELGVGQRGAHRMAVLDTGAQMNIVSTEWAFAAGLDKNGNGTLDDEVVGTEYISGVGGVPIPVPIVEADRVALVTEEGVDLVWTNVQMILLDIDDAISGIISCAPLTSGYFEPLIWGTGEYGCFEQIHLDWTGQGAGTMYLDVNPVYDVGSVSYPSGDLNHDDFVGQADLDIVLSSWGQHVTPASPPDPSGDGFVGQADLDIVLAGWGNGTQP